ncbi:MAG TPA: TraB/GumN family protein [Kofleriaceae bacterium]|nr:TraB/GumN family protein [Kofleriaceae bacterium]
MKRAVCVTSIVAGIGLLGVVPGAVAILGTGCRRAHEANATAEVTTTPRPEAGNAAGSAARPAATSAAPISLLPRPLLWAVEKDGTTSYFLGTMHVGIDPERLPPGVWDKLHAAATFAMEADLDDPAAAALLRPTEGSLHDQLGDDYWKKLEAAMGPSVARSLDHVPPMIPAAALSLRGLPQTTPMDKALAARAGELGKPIVFLEPASRQLAILGKWMNVKALKMMLDELPQEEQHARAMLDAYVDGDEARLVELGDREKQEALRHGYTAAEYDQEMSEMLYDRNASWLDALEKLHAAGGGFVAVGALHLVGPRSVLALLAGKGYRVTRLGPPATSAPDPQLRR